MFMVNPDIFLKIHFTYNATANYLFQTATVDEFDKVTRIYDMMSFKIRTFKNIKQKISTLFNRHLNISRFALIK